MASTGIFSWKLFDSFPVVGILRGFEIDMTLQLVEASYKGGLTNVEVTMSSPPML